MTKTAQHRVAMDANTGAAFGISFAATAIPATAAATAGARTAP